MAQAAQAVVVAAGALFDAQGRVLLAQRPPGKHLAGGWEFPGGKVQPGESDAAALARELTEELGIECVASDAFMTVNHDYPGRHVELRLRIVTRWHGEARGLEGQALRWVPVAELADAGILDADRPFIAALQRWHEQRR